MAITEISLTTQALDGTLIPSKISTNHADNFIFPGILNINNDLATLMLNTGNGATELASLSSDGTKVVLVNARSGILELSTQGAEVAIDNALSIGIGGPGINATAMLQINSTTKGFLPPRMTTTQRNAISSPATGLEIYNTTANEPEVYNGTAWTSMTPSSTFVDDQFTAPSSGTNQVFTLSQTPLANSEVVSHNGLVLRSGVDYTIVGTTLTILENVMTGESIQAIYATSMNGGGGGGGTPGGATTDVQYNLSGAFAGDSNFTWDHVNKILTLGVNGTQMGNLNTAGNITSLGVNPVFGDTNDTTDDFEMDLEANGQFASLVVNHTTGNLTIQTSGTQVAIGNPISLDGGTITTDGSGNMTFSAAGFIYLADSTAIQDLQAPSTFIQFLGSSSPSTITINSGLVQLVGDATVVNNLYVGPSGNTNQSLLVNIPYGNSLDPNAVMQVDFDRHTGGTPTPKGVLLPYMTTAQRDSMSGPTEALLIYNTDVHSYQQWNGSTWVSMSGGGSPAGSNTNVQFNSSGAFGADATFNWLGPGNGLQIGDVGNVLYLFTTDPTHVTIGCDPSRYICINTVPGSSLSVNDDESVVPDSSAIVDMGSTTQGFLPPRMTTTQRNAITSPAEGLVIYNTTTHKLNVYTTVWEQITSA
jgi:hypothetical protein